MKILKSQLRKKINEQVQAFFVTPQSMGMVGIRGNTEGNGSKLKEDDIDKNELKNIISQIVMMYRMLQLVACNRVLVEGLIILANLLKQLNGMMLLRGQ